MSNQICKNISDAEIKDRILQILKGKGLFCDTPMCNNLQGVKIYKDCDECKTEIILDLLCVVLNEGDENVVEK